jgi:hypothetical protein
MGLRTEEDDSDRARDLQVVVRESLSASQPLSNPTAMESRSLIILCRSLLSSLIVAASGPLSGQALLIDFNSNQDGGGDSIGFDPHAVSSAHLESGYQPYHANHEVAAEFSLGTYSAFGGVDNITILPTWPDTTDRRVMQSIDRGAGNDNNWGGTKLDLITDWIGADSRTGNGGNGAYDGVTGAPTRMLLTIGGLSAGDYSWRSYHHDTEHMNGEFIMEVSTDDGASFVQVGGVHQITDSTDGGNPASLMTYNGIADPASGDPADLPSTIETNFTATGDDVIIRFTPYSTTQVHKSFFALNGFELELETPVDLSVSPSNFLTSASQGTAVGSLTTTAGDPGDTFTYLLVAGDGDTDNGKFQIMGDQLEIGAHDFTTASDGEHFSIRVRSVGTPSTDEVEATVTLTALVPDDADADDLLDEWERLWAGDGNLGVLSGLAGANADGDTLTDLEEFSLRDQFPNLDPTKADSDGDSLDDGDELAGAGDRPVTDPTNLDTDGDGLDDGVETNTGIFVDATDTGTDPTNIDTDGDGFGDGTEVDAGTDPNVSDRPPLAGLLCAYWPLDGTEDGVTTPDLGPNGYHLDLVNMDAANFGNQDGRLAASFDGGTTMLTRTHSAGEGLPIAQHASYTISIWVKIAGTGQNDFRFFAEASNQSNDPLLNLGTRNNGSDDSVDLYLRDGGTPNHQFSNGMPLDGTWHHLAYTHSDADQKIQLFVDGVLDKDNWIFKDIISSLNTTSIGGILRANPSHWVTGFVDEVSLWKSVLPLEVIEKLASGTAVAELLNPTRLDVSFTSNGTDLVIDWASQAGKRYNLRSEADPSVAGPVDWPIYDDKMEIMATPPENSLTIPLPADAKRFFVIEEFPAPPVTVFSENFDGADPGWTTGFDALDADMNTIWELGDPVGGPVTAPSAANSAPNCYGTNLTENYGISSNIWLRTPNIDLTAAPGATLVFQQWLDMDEFDNLDRGMVRVLDASVLPGTVTELGVVQANITGFLNGWAAFSAELPAAALGQVISLEFGFVSDGDDIFDASGWYIDDVIVTIPGS